MNTKISLQPGPSQRVAQRVAWESEPMQYASAANPQHASYPNYTGAQKLEPLRKQNVRRVPPPKHLQPALRGHKGLLGRAFAWLRGGLTTEKKLRVIETVPLGEKRLVAIVEAEGRRFLVGCGSNGVSLLTSLKDEQDSTRETGSLSFAGFAG